MTTLGRPTKKTPSTERKILLALKGGNNRKTAAALAGISYNTFKAMLESIEFAQKCVEAERYGQSRLVGSIHKAAMERKVITVKTIETPSEDGPPEVRREITVKPEFDWKAALALLERRWPDEWKERKAVDVRNLTTEQLLKLLDALEEDEPGEEDTGGDQEEESAGSEAMEPPD